MCEVGTRTRNHKPETLPFALTRRDFLQIFPSEERVFQVLVVLHIYRFKINLLSANRVVDFPAYASPTPRDLLGLAYDEVASELVAIVIEFRLYSCKVIF